MLYYKKYELSPSHEWVVFIHGAGGSSSIWFKQIKAYKKHFNILLVDLRGHGKSQNVFKQLEHSVKKGYSFKEVSQDVIQVLDHLHIQTAHFVGISLGTIVIQTIGEIAPNRVSSMILGGAITQFDVRSKLLIMLGNFGKAFIPYMWLYRFFAWILMPKKRHERSRLLFVNEAKKLCQKEFIRWFKLAKEVHPIYIRLRDKPVNVPTLFIMGDEDYMFLPLVQDVVDNMKNATLSVIEDCGHVCNVDQSSQFNYVSILFIKKVTNHKQLSLG
jgi:pimeloyl-ACP methyl ester carboxylesterase